MSDHFLTFRKFNDPDAASELIEFLKSENIKCAVKDASPSLDVTFANNPLSKEIHVKIRQSDFDKVEKLMLEKESQISLNDLPKDYYLLDFTDEELMEILAKPDEWSPVDYTLSQKILKMRGKELSKEFLENLRRKRNDDLSEPEKSQKAWIYIGYFCALFGGFIGAIIGLHLLSHKRTLPNGQRVYGYIESDRKHGKNILIVAIIPVIFILVFWLFS